MKKNSILVFLFLLPFLTVEAIETSDLKLPKIQVVSIKDTQSDRQYELYIKLPEEYAKNKEKSYPVIYFTDALWHVELLSAATEYIMEDVILVGISWQKDIAEDLKQEYGAHVSRFGDYSFKKISNPKHPKIKFGQANNHLAFIRKDVFKYVEENYRTEPNNRTYFGFSAGGLFGTYALLTQPDTFKNYILGSPSIWKQAPDLFALENAALKSKDSAINVFISYGELEEKSSPHVEDFISTLKNKKYKGISSIKHIVIESSGHSDSFPVMGVQSVKWLSSLQTKEDKSVGQDDIQILEGPYLGQKPPSLIPEVFAPGIVSTEEYLETVVTFLPDMTELSFTRSGGKYKEPTLFVMQNTNNRWSRKSIPSTDINEYKERFNPSVSEMKSHEPFKDIPIIGFSVSSKGTYYFYVLDFDDGGSGHMSYSRLIDGKYEAPHKMSKAINTGKYIAHPFIAPDESYLMWDAEKEGEDTPDIYFSFRQKDGSWGAAIGMGDKINTAAYEQRPRVTPDGKYLFFWRGDKKIREDGSIYWVGNPYWVDFIQLKNELIEIAINKPLPSIYK